ncbi:gametocyte-specific factor 1 isoform X2 [Amia ocellicauda]|uniref:gametocyte-specific factor 1 isoform X2 n=1 Tax=Amia ocellicauda TaxID=2972642 RepID=UPI00346469E0
MASYHLGSSCLAEKNTIGGSARGWDEETGEDNPEKLLQCPYDKNHLIRACRFPYHLIKCSKNHPKLASELKTCPFNARHLMPKNELSHHMTNCADRCNIQSDKAGSAEVPCKWQVPLSTWQCPNNEEDWDKDADDVPPQPFIWGVSTSTINKINEDKPEPTTNGSLLPGLRAPRTLPWKN